MSDLSNGTNCSRPVWTVCNQGDKKKKEMLKIHSFIKVVTEIATNGEEK